MANGTPLTLYTIVGLVEHAGADPRWCGGPDAERVAAIKRAFWYDAEGQFGPRGRMYVLENGRTRVVRETADHISR